MDAVALIKAGFPVKKKVNLCGACMKPASEGRRFCTAYNFGKNRPRLDAVLGMALVRENVGLQPQYDEDEME